jgi:hypothetical protein
LCWGPIPARPSSFLLFSLFLAAFEQTEIQNSAKSQRVIRTERCLMKILNVAIIKLEANTFTEQQDASPPKSHISDYWEYIASTPFNHIYKYLGGNHIRFTTKQSSSLV